ncbi:hypothetical protein LINGRAPRIM_LOCUS846, partial [Linum grandiflorum]
MNILCRFEISDQFKMEEEGSVDFRQGDEFELWAFRSSTNSVDNEK